MFYQKSGFDLLIVWGSSMKQGPSENCRGISYVACVANLLSSPLFSSSLVIATQIRVHTEGPSPPRAQICLHEYLLREKFSYFFSTSSTRAESCIHTHNARRYPLVSFCERERPLAGSELTTNRSQCSTRSKSLIRGTK